MSELHNILDNHNTEKEYKMLARQPSNKHWRRTLSILALTALTLGGILLLSLGALGATSTSAATSNKATKPAKPAKPANRPYHTSPRDVTIPGTPLQIIVRPSGSYGVNRDGVQQLYSDGGAYAEGVFLWASGTVYGPEDVPGGNYVNEYTQISQSPLTGSGASADPWVVTNELGVGDTGLILTQRVSYVNGQQRVRTDWSLCFANNTSGRGKGVVVHLFHAADLYTGGNDFGYGYYSNGAVGGSNPDHSLTQIFDPIFPAPATAYEEADYRDIWNAIGDVNGTGPGFNDTYFTDDVVDNGAGLQWELFVPYFAGCGANGEGGPSNQASDYIRYFVPPPICGPDSDYVITTTAGDPFVPGVTDIGNHCDDCLTAITLPFTFNLYGQPFNSVNVSSNGNLQFTTNDTAFSNTCLPYPSFGNAILPHWDDLRTDSFWSACTGYPGDQCGIFTDVQGTAPNRTFIIEWRAAYFDNTVQKANFEVILHEHQGPQGESSFDAYYQTIDEGGGSATVGVQRDDGQFTQYECNTGGITDGLRHHYSQPACSTPTPTSTPSPTNTPTFTPTPTPTSASGVMQGGGTVSNRVMNVHHGETLHCNATLGPNQLEVNWTTDGNRGSSKFHLDTLTSAYCYDDPTIDPGKPDTDFDTYRGSGTGAYNGVPGATAQWLFTDAGEPGGHDYVRYLVRDANNQIVLSISGYLTSGNQQAMREHP